jgi:hypothetical protein
MVLELAQETGVPLVVTLGGGYAEPIELTAEAHAGTFRMAAAVLGRLATGDTAEASE